MSGCEGQRDRNQGTDREGESLESSHLGRAPIWVDKSQGPPVLNKVEPETRPDRRRINRPEGTSRHPPAVPVPTHDHPAPHHSARHDRPRAVDSRGYPERGHPQPTRGLVPMSHARRLSSVALAVLVGASAAACVTAPPGWTYTPAPSVTPPPSVGHPGRPSGSRRPSGSASGRGGRDLGIGDRVRADQRHGAGRQGVPDCLRQQGRRYAPQRRHPQGQPERRRGVQGRDRHRAGDQDLRRSGARCRHLRVRVQRASQHDRHAHGPDRPERDDPDRRAALLFGRLPALGRGDGSPRSRPAMRRCSSSIERSSIRVAADSHPIAASSCAPRTGDRGRSGRRARSAARSSTSSSPTAAIRRPSGTRSASISTGPGAWP